MTDTITPILRGPAALTRHSQAPDATVDGIGESKGFLCFKMDDREYGVDLNLISQIVRPPPLTWVPRVDPHILGIISIRGAVVTLVDLRQLMNLQPTSWPRAAKVLLVELEEEQIGLLVDNITQVRLIAPSDLERNPS
ncbi:MAG: chemotaxis protein CheW, partial [Deltaproteobacteria bacterium]|nr:chemotaxis protein CheW [Deltaproteobacteria bacterium]